MAWKLTPLRGAVEPVILGQNAIVFGRHHDNAVVLDDDMCSRKHCQITLDAKEGYVVKDLGSRNGTKVNDQRIPGPTTLRLGDVLRVGGHEFLVERAEPDVSSADSSVMGAVIDSSIEQSIFTTDPHEASAAISTGAVSATAAIGATGIATVSTGAGACVGATTTAGLRRPRIPRTIHIRPKRQHSAPCCSSIPCFQAVGPAPA